MSPVMRDAASRIKSADTVHDLAAELATLPGKYAPPAGMLLSALAVLRHAGGGQDFPWPEDRPALKARRGKARVFFSEEKKQKTFVLSPVARLEAMAGWIEAARISKSFGS